MPLLLCDQRTVRKNDLVEVDRVLPDKVEKGFYLFYRDSQEWYWLSSQRPEEVTIFKTWDSERIVDEAGQFAPARRKREKAANELSLSSTWCRENRTTKYRCATKRERRGAHDSITGIKHRRIRFPSHPSINQTPLNLTPTIRCCCFRVQVRFRFQVFAYLRF